MSNAIEQFTVDEINVFITAGFENEYRYDAEHPLEAVHTILHQLALYALDASIAYDKQKMPNDSQKAYHYYYVITEALRKNGYYDRSINNIDVLPNVPIVPIND